MARKGEAAVGELAPLEAPATAEKVSKISKPTGKRGGARPNSGGARPGAGRPAGVPNKIHADVKAGILEAFERAGGPEYLHKIAMDDPRTFCGLLGKVLPMQVVGDPDRPVGIQITWGKTE